MEDGLGSQGACRKLMVRVSTALPGLGITVQNETPQESISLMAIFTIRPEGEGPVEVYLPSIRR